MAVTDAYASAATYRALIDKSDTGEDAEILTDLTAVSRWMERKLGRFFTTDASAVKRVYQSTPYSNQPKSLFIDDLVTVTAIKADTDDDGTFADGRQKQVLPPQVAHLVDLDDDELKDAKIEAPENRCFVCGFEAKSERGLKTHRKRKHNI